MVILSLSNATKKVCKENAGLWAIRKSPALKNAGLRFMDVTRLNYSSLCSSSVCSFMLRIKSVAFCASEAAL